MGEVAQERSGVELQRRRDGELRVRLGDAPVRAQLVLTLLCAACDAEVETTPSATNGWNGPNVEVAGPDPCSSLTYEACGETPSEWGCQWWITRTNVVGCSGEYKNVGCFSRFATQCGADVPCLDHGTCDRVCAEGQECTTFTDQGSCSGNVDSGLACNHGPCENGSFSLCLPAIPVPEGAP